MLQLVCGRSQNFCPQLVTKEFWISISNTLLLPYLLCGVLFADQLLLEGGRGRALFSKDNWWAARLSKASFLLEVGDFNFLAHSLSILFSPLIFSSHT